MWVYIRIYIYTHTQGYNVSPSSSWVQSVCPVATRQSQSLQSPWSPSSQLPCGGCSAPQGSPSPPQPLQQLPGLPQQPPPTSQLPPRPPYQLVQLPPCCCSHSRPCQVLSCGHESQLLAPRHPTSLHVVMRIPHPGQSEFHEKRG